MSNCQTCAVRNRAICSALDSREIHALDKISRPRTLSAGHSLLWEGDDSILVGNVVEGVLKLSMSTSDGSEQIVGIVYPADFIGRPFGGAMPYSVTAITDARVCMVARDDFDRLAHAHPALEQKLLERTLDELDRTRSRMLALGRKGAGEKLAAFLIELSERIVEPGRAPAKPHFDDRIEIPFTRQQIADLLGMTIETVSRQFTRLTTQKLVSLPSRRQVVILNRPALELQAG